LPLGFSDVDCGSYACLLGWYERHTGENSVYVWAMPREHFGISEEDADLLFRAVKELNAEGASLNPAADRPGPAAYAELERRLIYLRKLIAERQPKGMPDSVRAIFTVSPPTAVEEYPQ
jgi:hypothetical protein